MEVGSLFSTRPSSPLSASRNAPKLTRARYSTHRWSAPPAYAALSEISHVSLETNARPGATWGDNWDVMRVRILGFGGGRNMVLFDQSGVPLTRLTGEDPREAFRIRVGS